MVTTVKIIAINYLVDDTKNRRKNIRNSYFRNKMKSGTGSVGSNKMKWILTQRLSFLDRVESEQE